MARYIRSAKSACRWDHNELIAYNISITATPPAEFFLSDPDLASLDFLDPAILTSDINAANHIPHLSHVAAQYFHHLRLATRTTQEVEIDDFAVKILELMGFIEDLTNTISIRHKITLIISGEKRSAATNICLIHEPTKTLLVLVEDKTLRNRSNAEAQVIAEAIAAFQFNNKQRVVNNKPTLKAMTIPCIIMIGTNPTFYLVPVTEKLSEAVKTAQYPETETRVLMCSTTGTHARRVSEGMADVQYRRLALKRFLAFKSLAMSHWQQCID